MKAAPAPPLKVAQTDLLLEFLIIPLDAPARFRQVNKVPQDGVLRQGREPVLGRPLLALRPFNQAPFLSAQRSAPIIPMGGPNPHSRKARSQRGLGAFAPRHDVPCRVR